MNVRKHKDDNLYKEAGVQNKKQQEQKLSHSCSMFKSSSTKHANQYPYNI